jgi:transcriptional regulator with XRE-family HTH domain
MNHMNLNGLKKLKQLRRINERTLAENADVSRGTLRSILSSDGNVTLSSLEKVSHALGKKALLTLVSELEVSSDDSIPVISLLISQDEKWRLHLFNFVDAFRRVKDPRLVMLPPVKKLPRRYQALLASTVAQLCTELGMESPLWALRSYYLPEPWFVSEVESLKAMAIQESPLFFRRNNIFVLENFLSRA